MTVESTDGPAEPIGGAAQLPSEALLLDMDDTAAGADLKGKVREAWQDFARTLAAALRRLAPGTVLDVTLDPTASGTGDAVYEVRVTVGESGELTALAVGNALLPEGYRLDRAAVGALVALGWSPPGVLDGSGGFFGLRLPTSEISQLAVILSRTLRDVYGAPHPAFLTYEASDAAGEAVNIGALGAARLLAAGAGAGESDEDATERALSRLGDDMIELPLADQVAAVVASLLKTTPDALSVDPDGDIGIRAGSAMVFVRVRDNPPLIDVFSPVLTAVEPSERLYVKLSELTNRMPIGRLYCTNDTVWASVPVFGRDFQPTHLMLAVQVMTGLADELDDRLHGEFGGKRFFGEGDKPAGRSAENERTGMYL
ncbi:T3SS (YopN, CesT) and YbjN peptide-binding chaperone 1 [Planosporangium sp. 12N6]|uniref:T3SS (YopN, CesT) and YbjN peptide-binding chaperone 1 n=1 Tax=Planosporangium spinosum TaxID=3402278 RepID=UPI003CF3D996